MLGQRLSRDRGQRQVRWPAPVLSARRPCGRPVQLPIDLAGQVLAADQADLELYGVPGAAVVLAW
jgi:hypothetical protein